MSNNLLPEEYEVPQKLGNYFKFVDGENKFRFLSAPIMGYEWWEDQEDGTRKPVRVPMGVNIPLESVTDPQSIKHFWAMPVWNYKEKRVQILEVTQKGIQKSLRALEKSKDWGSLLGYDILVTKSGQKLETEYSVNPVPPKPLDKEIAEAFESTTIDLEALYRGDDPFKGETVNPDDIPDK